MLINSRANDSLSGDPGQGCLLSAGRPPRLPPPLTGLADLNWVTANDARLPHNVMAYLGARDDRWLACRFISEQNHPQTCFETSNYAKLRDGASEEPLILQAVVRVKPAWHVRPDRRWV
jgi:hypothetical protein